MIFQVFDTVTGKLSFRLTAPDLDTANVRAVQYVTGDDNLPSKSEIFVCLDPDQEENYQLMRYHVQYINPRS